MCEDEEEEEEETYRSVEKAFVVHGQVEFGLDSLDGHHTEPHRDQVKDSCRSTGGGQGCKYGWTSSLASSNITFLV